MTIQTVDGWDCTGAALPQAPKTGQAAGYITGSGDVPWSAAQQAAHPGFVQIDQTPVITTFDVRADSYDVENSAVTIAEIAELVHDGQAAYKAVARPGQRWPAVYCSRSLVTPVVNALIKGGITSCPLGVADYDFNHAAAQAEVANASGPFPIVWRQYSDQGGGGAYDLDVFSVPWLNTVSKLPDPPVPPVVVPKGDNLMLHLSVTAPTGHTWTGTRTFLYLPGGVPVHIVDQPSENAIQAQIPKVIVTWEQYVSIGGV